MACFSYDAFSDQGERCQGYREAKTSAFLAKSLAAEGLQLISCRRVFWTALLKRPNEGELQDFARHMAALLKAGFSLEEALEMYEGSPSYHALIHALLTDIKKGQPFSKALQHRMAFKDPLVFALISVSEKRGDLGSGFEALVTHLQQTKDLKNKILHALGYPVLLFVLILCLTGFLLTEVVPQLEAFLVSAGAELPVLSKILVSCSAILSAWILPLFLGISILVLVGVSLKKLTLKGALLVGKKLNQVPVLGPLLYHRDQLRFVQNLGILLASEVPLLEALQIAATGNTLFFQNSLERVVERVQSGLSLSQAFEQEKCLETRSLRFVHAGELSGCLPTLLKDLASLLKTESDLKSTRIVAFLEPGALIIVGSLLAWIVSAFFLPLYEHLNDMGF